MTRTDDSFTVASHFEGKNSVRRIYDRLLKEARRFGTVIEEPKNTSLHMVNRTAFAGVAMRQHALIVTIKSDGNVPRPRIHKYAHLPSTQYHQQLKHD